MLMEDSTEKAACISSAPSFQSRPQAPRQGALTAGSRETAVMLSVQKKKTGTAACSCNAPHLVTISGTKREAPHSWLQGASARGAGDVHDALRGRLCLGGMLRCRRGLAVVEVDDLFTRPAEYW